MTIISKRAWIYTNSGNMFDLSDPTPEMIKIEDIAHALSHICRYTGHVKEFYSVALHSLIVSEIVPAEFALEGLLHDAAEAYLNDISAPLKTLLPDYRDIETRVESVIAKKFQLRYDPFHFIDIADKYIYIQESEHFFAKHEEFDLDLTGLNQGDYSHMFSNTISPKHIAESFLTRYRHLVFQQMGTSIDL